MRPLPRQPAPRASLSRDAIVAAALGVVEAEGLGALTMRRVAEELSVSPMSLYRHVEDRQGLLLGMLDAVALDIAPTPADDDPRREASAILHSLHRAFRAHPWVVRVLAVDGLASAHILPLMDQMFSCLFRAGLDEDAARRAWKALFEYLVGEAMFPRTSEPSYAQRLMWATNTDELPALARLLAWTGTADPDADFSANLTRLLACLLPG